MLLVLLLGLVNTVFFSGLCKHFIFSVRTGGGFISQGFIFWIQIRLTVVPLIPVHGGKTVLLMLSGKDECDH